MSRFSGLLLLIIVVELLVAGVLVVGRLQRREPPRPDWALLDPDTAAQLQEAAAACVSADDWHDLAELYMAAGCFAESAACHGVACELAPHNAQFARHWGFAQERLALLEEANAQYRRAIDLGIPNPDACRYFIARNHLRVENAAAARRVFAEGQALEANRFELARLDLREGKLAPAADWLRDIAAVRPNALQLQQLEYRLAQEHGDARQALACADRVRYASEKLPTPFDEEAERVIQVTQRLGPNRHWKHCRDLINAGRQGEAEQMLEVAGRRYRGPVVVELLAELAFHRGQLDLALRRFEEFQEQHGPAARITARMGDVWDADGEPEKARASWLRAAALGAGVDLKAIHHNLAKSWAQSGDSAAAARHLARGHYYVGRDLLQLGHPDKAIAYFAAAVKHDPELAQAWFYLGEARRLASEKDSAFAAYRECLRLNPDHGRALAGLALLGAGEEK